MGCQVREFPAKLGYFYTVVAGCFFNSAVVERIAVVIFEVKFSYSLYETDSRYDYEVRRCLKRLLEQSMEAKGGLPSL